MQYLLITVVLFLLELLYFKVLADRYNIVDKPNHRSAHTGLRGGGIIFWFALLLFYTPQNNYFFFLGDSLVSVVSFFGMTFRFV
jgi:hypothetical protein